MKTFYIWEWANEAKKEIDSKLSLYNENFHDTQINTGDIQDKLIVILISKTQSGKTTFALNLLGVPEENIQCVYKALRGNRPLGISSTAITTEYYAVDDEKGRIGDKTFDSWKDFGKEIDEIRKKREICKKQSKTEQQFVKIGIPAKGGVASRVIELMGLDSKEEWERVASKEAADYWLKAADLIMYVVNAANIADLSEQHEEYRVFLNRWRILPDSHKIAVTRTFQSLEMKKQLDKIKEPEALIDTALEYLTQEIKRMTKNDNLPSLFPLELIKPQNIGDDSWKKVKESKEIVLQNIRDTLKSDPVLFRIKRVFDYRMGVIKNMNEQLSIRKKEREEIEKEVNKIKEEVSNIEQMCSKVKEEKIKNAEIKQQIKRAFEASSENIVSNINKCSGKKFIKINSNKYSKWRDRVYHSMFDFSKELKDIYDSACDELKRVISKKHSLKLPIVNKKELRALSTPYVENDYNQKVHSIGPGSEDRLKKRFVDWCNNKIFYLFKSFEVFCESYQNEINAEFENIISKIRREENKWKGSLDRKNKELASANEELNKKTNNLVELEKKMKEILKIIDSIPEVFSKYFIKQWNSFITLLDEKAKVDKNLSFIEDIVNIYRLNCSLHKLTVVVKEGK